MKNTLLKIRNWFRANKNAKNPFIRTFVNTMYCFRKSYTVIHLILTDDMYRSVTATQLFHPGRTQQTTQMTFMDRYPQVFTECKQYFEGKNGKKLRILSFGCCTGEEVVTLRQYFPDAVIIGAEINKNSLKICRSRDVDSRIRFIDSKKSLINKYGPYDMVFAMAVLQRTPHSVRDNNIQSLKKLYPFEKFEKQCQELDGYVKPDGLLIIHNTQYELLDTKVGDHYAVYGDSTHVSDLFDKNSDAVSRQTPRKSIYRKSSQA